MFRSYYYNYWLGYLTHLIASKCMQKAKQRCLGCQDRKTSALLHPHLQMSLLEKMVCYLDEARAELIQGISEYFEKFKERVGVNEDEQLFCSPGQTFLLTATPNSLFYGRYLDDEIDSTLFPKPLGNVGPSSTDISRPEKPRRKRPAPIAAVESLSNKTKKKSVDDTYSFSD